VFEVPELDRLELPHCGDAAVGIYLPTADSTDSTGRTYTVRQHDPTTHCITVDVLLHGGAAGTQWATNVAPGDRVELAHAKSWYAPPPWADWQLLVADLTGLPALARIVEQGVLEHTVAIVEVLHPGDLGYLQIPPSVSLVTSIGTGNAAAPSALAELTRQHCRDADGYCWFAGEATDARTVHRFLRRECLWLPEQLDVMGYWRRDADDWAKRFAPHGPQLYNVYQQAVAEGKSKKVALEKFDDAAERLGL
jgi:NADPH-dependent ferric siderophore reductase